MYDQYDEQKEKVGRTSTYVFIISALYLFVSDGGGSLLSLEALVFIAVGMFAVVLIIGVPTYLVQRGVSKVLIRIFSPPPSRGMVITATSIGIMLMLAQYGATFYAAEYAYNMLVRDDNRPIVATIETVVPVEIQCKEPLPAFTLGRESRPSEERIYNLCSCMWEDFSEWEKNVSQAIAEGRDSETPTLEQYAFPASFRRAVKKCGGMDL